MNQKRIFYPIMVLAISLCHFTTMSAQFYEVTLAEKVSNSTLIVEGEVVSTQSYVDEKNQIYTANKIRINKILKGSFSEEHLTIVTMGGTYEKRYGVWSHMLTLKAKERGMFFLFPTDRPMIDSPDFPR